MKNNRISNLAEFRRWVKIRLVEKEISQNELARQMGIPHARISEATHGKQSGNKYIIEIIRAAVIVDEGIKVTVEAEKGK